MSKKDDLTPENLPHMTTMQVPEEAEESAQLLEGEDPPVEAALSEADMQRALEIVREEQNLLIGAAAGFLTAIVGAAVWAGVTVAAEAVIGWMAVVVGVATGLAVRVAGKGIDQIFGVVGAVMALLGCVLGKIFTIAWYVAADTGTPVIEVLGQMDVPIVIELVVDSFQLEDILFYALAVYFGYRYALRELDAEDLDRALGKTMPT